MYYRPLAERVRFYKESKEGVVIMCKALEEMREQTLKEGIEIGKKDNQIKTARRMLADGKYSLEEIVNLLELSYDEVVQLKAERRG